MSIRKKLIIGLLLLLPGWQLLGQLRLPALCSDSMVLQRGSRVPVWGWAAKGGQVQVNFLGHSYSVTADQEGRWKILLPAMTAGGPYQMTITAGPEKVTLKDILIGEVWVCSGQSNMEHDLKSVEERYPRLIADSAYPLIRQFKVPAAYDFNQVLEDYQGGRWLAATSQHIGQFTAVGFFFAQRLFQTLKVPVGIINISLGGSPIEAWLPESVLRSYPRDYQQLKRFKDERAVTEVQQRDRAAAERWQQELMLADQGERLGWQSLPCSSATVRNWPSMTVPGYWADQGLGFVNGVVWLKKSLTLRKGATLKTARLVLGRMVDADSVFVNGTYVGSTTYQYPRRRYDFSDDLLVEGENTITIRLESQSGKGGFVPDKPYVLVRGEDSVSLAGTWKYQMGAQMEKAPSQTFVNWMPAGLYNAMLAPAFHYGVKGFIWYQGESNTDNALEYGQKLKHLLHSVRRGWNDSLLAFLVVQLPNFMQQSWDAGSNSDWAELRQQQARILSEPATGLAVTLGLGEWNDVHPLNKQPVGQRLYLLAADLCYGGLSGHMGYATSPVAAKAVAVPAVHGGDSVYIEFRAAQTLSIREGDERLLHFALAGADGNYLWALAGIKGDRVWVYSPEVPHPIKVRYGWSDNPLRANLENTSGLPAAPFELPVHR